MEVRSGFKSILSIIFLFSLTACFEKNVNTVMTSGKSISPTCSGQAMPHQYIVEWEDGAISLEYATDESDFRERFVRPNIDAIKSVTQDRIIHIEEVNSYSTNSEDSWGQQMIGATSVWSENVKGQGIIVGVVDSFVDIKHPQLVSQIAINSKEIDGNGIDDDNNGLVDDYYGAVFISNPEKSDPNQPISEHGTHVSGIIAANHENGPVLGLAPGSQIVPAQFLSDSGAGSLGDAIFALNYVADRGAKIINSSWGGAPCVAALRNSFEQLEKRGVLLIVAAGNSARDIERSPEYPAAFNVSTQITVAASTKNDYMSYFSNSGFNLVHLAAPGESIYSTIPGNSYKSMNGTSMAAPFVSGAAALIWSARPTATAQQVKNALLRSVDVVPGHEYRVSSKGRVNIAKALQILRTM